MAADMKSRQGLQLISKETFDLSGDVHQVVTFLNQALKDKGIIFGLTRVQDKYGLAVYVTDEYEA